MCTKVCKIIDSMLTPATAGSIPLSFLLNHALGAISECLPSDREVLVNSDAGHGHLNEIFTGLSTVQRVIPCMQPSREEKRAVWHMISKLWKWADNVQNAATDAPLWVAFIRQRTSDVMELMGDNELSWDQRSAKVVIYHEIGVERAKAGEHVAAEIAYSKAQAQSTRLIKALQGEDVPGAVQADTLAGCMDFLFDRLANAWALHQTAVASECISQATELLEQATLLYQQRFSMQRQDILGCVRRRQERQCAKHIDAQGLLDYTYQRVTEHLVLRLLSQAYLLCGQSEHALVCVQSVRKLQDPPDNAPSLCLTAIEALMQLEKPAQANAELLALVSHKDASAALCLAALSAVLQAPCCNAVKPAIDHVLERFAEDATVAVSLVQALLGASEEEKEREALVLDIVRYEEIHQLFTKADGSTKDERKILYMLLWDRATQHFTSRDYRACVQFYFGAGVYAEPDAEEIVSRRLTQVQLAMPELFRSLENLGIASEPDPSPIDSEVTRIEVLLMQGKARKAVDLLQPLLDGDVACDFLRLRDTPLPSAKQALRMLWEDVVALQSPSRRPGKDANIARNLILLTAEMEEGYDLWPASSEPCASAEGCQHSRPDTGSGERGGQDSIHQQLAGLFSQVVDRLEAVGRDSFFGPEPPDWFAFAAFSAGTTAMDPGKDPVAAAVLFRASGSISEALPCPSPEELKLRRDAHFLSIKYTLAEYAVHPEPRSCLDLAHALRQKASAALEAAMQLPLSPEDLQDAKKGMWQVEMDLAMKESRYAQMAPLVEQAATEGLFTADELLHIGYVCLEIPRYPHAPSARVAFSAALRLMRPQKGPPCMEKLAETVNELYKVSSDEEALTLLADVAAYARSSETPPYPSSEMSWLIYTAWNQGNKHARYLRHPLALSFVAAAIDLMDFSDDFKGNKKGYEMFYKKLKKDRSEGGSAGF